MKRIFYLLLPAIALLGAPACKKSESSMNTITPGGYSSLDDIFARTANVTVKQSINVASGGVVISKGGTRVIFTKDCFQTYAGVVVTGSVDVEVTDWLKKGDMVFGRVLPISNSFAMNTAGQCYIKVTQKGNPVRLRKGYKALVLFPQFGRTISGADSLYLGRKIIGSVNTVDWYAQDTAGAFDASRPDTLGMYTDSLNYIAASRFLPFPAYCNFKVKVNAPTNLEQSIAVAILGDDNSVYPIASITNGTAEIDAQRVPQMKLIMAVMGVNKGVFYGGIQPIADPKADSVYQVDVKQVEAQTFRQMLNVF